MNATHVKAYHKQIESLLGREAEEHARRTGFAQRRGPMTGAAFVTMLIWTVLCEPTRSLPAMARILDAICGVRVSLQGLDQRFTTRAVAFLHQILASLLDHRLDLDARLDPRLGAFSALYLLDSTSVALPETLASHYRGTGGSASTSAVKLFWVSEWLRGTSFGLRLRHATKADQNMGLTMLDATRAGALWLFDLGFWSAAFLRAIAAHGSFFLTRLQPGVGVWVRTAGARTALSVDAWLECVGPDAVECDIEVGAAATSVSARLVAVAVPAAVANERRRKLRRAAQRQGRTPKASTLFRQGWTLWVTNAPLEHLPAACVGEVYRLRWQIELLFKRAKSEAGLARSRSHKPERVLCEFYAVLITTLLVEGLSALARADGTPLSDTRVWRALRQHVAAWGRAMNRRGGWRALDRILAWLRRHATPSPRRSYPSIQQRLPQAAPHLLPPPPSLPHSHPLLSPHQSLSLPPAP